MTLVSPHKNHTDKTKKAKSNCSLGAEERCAGSCPPIEVQALREINLKSTLFWKGLNMLPCPETKPLLKQLTALKKCSYGHCRAASQALLHVSNKQSFISVSTKSSLPFFEQASRQVLYTTASCSTLESWGMGQKVPRQGEAAELTSPVARPACFGWLALHFGSRPSRNRFSPHQVCQGLLTDPWYWY